jgi:glycosyltransferase involved in cell wall biosynthesis
MSGPTVSIIIPAYNAAAYLPDSVQSVREQTFTDWELLIVDDGSTDNTAAVSAQFDDSRIRYIYQENKGLPGARNTGIRAATGSYLAFLDADDRYHPDKLARQVGFLEQRPEVGLVYASRIDIDQDGNLLTLRQAPAQVQLKDLVLGYPFVINDILVRRHWVDAIDGFDESFLLNSEDRDFYLRLALAGCQFAGLPDFLSYRRFHAGRHFRHIPAKIETYFRALDTLFKDPRCPPDVLALREEAHAQHYVIWGYQAAIQAEVELAQAYLRQGVALDASWLEDDGLTLLHFAAHTSVRDGGEPEAQLRQFFTTLPPEMSKLLAYQDQIIGRAYLMSGLNGLIWDRRHVAARHMAQAIDKQARLDKKLWSMLNDQIFQFQVAFGETAAEEVVARLLPYLERISRPAELRHFKATWAFNRAVKHYRSGQFSRVPGQVMQAIFNDPRYLHNRGALSIMARSLWFAART